MGKPWCVNINRMCDNWKTILDRVERFETEEDAQYYFTNFNELAGKIFEVPMVADRPYYDPI